MRATNRWLPIIALMLANACVAGAGAADGRLSVTISPDVAYQVREWRRAHGLPQEPEVTLPHAVTDGRGAVAQALRLIGRETTSSGDPHISVERHGAHWRVTIDAQGEAPGYVVDVAASIANSTAIH